MVAAGQFRADLYYRLNGFPIALPPLRERADDIPLLVSHFLGRYARELGKPMCQVPAETLALLARYGWPGNVRELQGTLKQAMIQATGPVLLPEFLPAALREPPGGAVATPSDGGEANELDQFIAARLRGGTQSLRAELIAPRRAHLVGSRTPVHAGQPVAGRLYPWHYPRLAAQQDPRAWHPHQPIRSAWKTTRARIRPTCAVRRRSMAMRNHANTSRSRATVRRTEVESCLALEIRLGAADACRGRPSFVRTGTPLL